MDAAAGNHDTSDSANHNHHNEKLIIQAAGVVLQFLEWAGLEASSSALIEECREKGWPPLALPTLEGLRRSSTSASTDSLPPGASVLIDSFDAGLGTQFFEGWQRIKSNQEPEILKKLITLEFDLHVYFATLPMRTGNRQDHQAAMAVFRRYLETCGPSQGNVPDQLPFYALPYVLDPTQHPVFQTIFQPSWVSALKERLVSWLKGVHPPLPLLMSYLKKPSNCIPRISSSVTTSVVTAETAVDARRGQRTMKRRLQRLHEDYYKLLGVSWELTMALDESVHGRPIDLETILSACTHRHPDLFSSAICDTQASAVSILKESVQPNRRQPTGVVSVSALDFIRVRTALRAAPEHNVILLLQALRQRITQVTNGGVRDAVVMSYVRGDFLEVTKNDIIKPFEVARLAGSGNVAILENPILEEGEEANPKEKTYHHTCWQRIAEALTRPHSDPLAQASARLLSTLASFSVGRSYLTKNEVVTMTLLDSMKLDSADSITSDMVLATLQKLSVRGQVQLRLIRGGAVEWLSQVISVPGECLPPYTLEYASALLLNLTLRSTGRARAAPLSSTLLPALADLLSRASSSITPYITGAMYSLLSHEDIRGEATQLGLHHSLYKLAQNSPSEHRRQIEYLIQQIEREDTPTPPPSPPDSPRHLEDDPEWLEEELDLQDVIKLQSNELTGEDLLNYQYALHGSDALNNSFSEVTSARSAPAQHWDLYSARGTTRPYSDGVSVPNPKIHSNSWDYPADSDANQTNVQRYSPNSRSVSTEEKYYRNAAWEERSEEQEKTPQSRSESMASQYYHKGSPVPRTEVEVIHSSSSPRPLTPESSDVQHINRNKASSSLDSQVFAEDTDDLANTIQSTYTIQNDDNDDVLTSQHTPEADLHKSIEDQFTRREQLSESEEPETRDPIEDTILQENEDQQPIINKSYSRRSSYTISRDDGASSSLINPEFNNPSSVINENEQQSRIIDDDASMERPSQENTLKSRKNSVVTESIEELPHGDDKTAIQVVAQLMGESRKLTNASKAPDSANDPLLRSLPSPKVTEYVVAFSSRPRIPRSPPRSADIHECRESSPRSVLPPISKTNLTYSRKQYPT